MESHPLNLAHQQYRRAEAHLKFKRFDEAMQCHHNAAQLLKDAMTSTTSSVALESISLQHSYHIKQKDLIKNKKDQYQRVKKAMENLKNISKQPTSLQGADNAKIQVAIYRAIQETDSLLDILSNKKVEKTNQRFSGNDIASHSNEIVDGKPGKHQETIIEELQVLSQNLHSLVEQLVMQVEVLKDENGTLKERVEFLEKERTKYLNIQGLEFVAQESDESSGTQIMDPQPTRTYPNIPLRQNQPHFDLSAFRND